ncbi:MAG: hypothetical protein MJ053_05700 [Elusimicrobiaceae bacterium]|nr:hypothetical protein [Elusimicrobiaceae bacterium]
MKWFSFLTNKSGKLRFGIPQMAAVVGVGFVISYTALQADKKAVEEARVRSVSSIAGGSNYGGMFVDGRGNLTSINVKDGLNQVATAEERARIENGRTGGGDFGMSAADNVGGRFSSSVSGRAAETSETEGLGMGRNEAVLVGSGARGGNVSGADVGPVGAIPTGNSTAGSRASAKQGTEGKQLASSSITRATGTGVNNSYGPITSGGAETAGGNTLPGGRVSGGGKIGGEGYNFSGAMPRGTDPLSLSGGAQGRSTFMAGGRHGSAGRGSRSKGTGNDLKDITKRSVEVARNQNRSSNEGARPFLAASTNSGGMSIEGGVETTQTGSQDFEPATTRKLKGIGNWGADAKDETDKQSTHQTIIFALLFGMIALSCVMWKLIAAARKLGEVPIYGIAGNAMAIILAVALTVLWLGLSGYAAWYDSTYFEGSVSKLSLASWIVSGVGIGITWIVFASNSAADATTKEGSEAIANATAGFKGTLSSGAKKLASGVVLPAAQQAVQESILDADSDKD